MDTATKIGEAIKSLMENDAMTAKGFRAVGRVLDNEPLYYYSDGVLDGIKMAVSKICDVLVDDHPEVVEDVIDFLQELIDKEEDAA